MGAFAVAFILISGYIYVSNSTFQMYITRREDGHRYYFRCGAYGIFFCLIGIIISIALDRFNIPTIALKCIFRTSIEELTGVTQYTKSLQDYLSLKMVLGSSLAVVLAPLASKLDNFFRDDEQSRNYIHKEKSPALEKFLFECGSELQTVLITLKSRKVYVGMVNDIPIESGDVEHFSILPILSGYRDKDKLTVSFTTNYYLHYQNNLNDEGEPVDGSGACLDDFVEMIPVSEIAHIGRFDIDTYKSFIKPIGAESVTPWMDLQEFPIDRSGSANITPNEKA
ncbi:hypothetical protein GCM10009347_01470 [Shewanella algicola]|uniref:Uncharacterized protein n=1 Tax=Shewanella algicola TaxID=640633 RepID=A0A9X2CC01_9GAMM|nr:hypothetical protein [Shewanella algicola]MCL1103751.1 hypothetical protein [Shewanella algicola]GGP37220.1 hypothetical protein GCM10009347_01470 [Shewanella algicola]